MSKRIYRAVSVNTIALPDLGIQRDEPVVVAIDVAKVDNKAALILGGRVVRTVGWKAPAETLTFVELVRGLTQLSKVEVVMESTGTYGDPLRAQMARLGVPVFRVHAKHTHDAAELFDGVPSIHDAKASHLIGWLHVQKRSRPWPMKSDEARDVAAAAESYELYNGQLMACLSRIEAWLARHFPELTEVVSLQNKSTLALLESFGGPQAIAQNAAAAAKLMRDVGGHFLDPAKVDRIIVAARATTGDKMTAIERRTLQQLAGEARRLDLLKADAHAVLEECTAKKEEARRVAEVIGATTAAIVWAEAGEIAAYASPAAYVKALGLNLKIKSSGKCEGQLKLTKRGSSRARKYLYLAVLRLIQHEPHFKVWYARKVEREGGQRKLKALTALMRKLASALWYVARGAPFEPAKLFDAKRLGLEA
jgi:transposase